MEATGVVQKNLPPPTAWLILILWFVFSDMNPEDKMLSALLKGSLLGIEPDHGFNRRVWSRIEALESRRNGGLDSLFSWLQLIARPRLAVASVAIALFGGVMIGGLQAQGSQEQRYLRSLSPHAAHR